MPRPVCIPCNREYHMYKNGVLLHIGHDNYYSGDMWECPGCGHTLVSGFGQEFFQLEKHKTGDLVVADLSITEGS